MAKKTLTLNIGASSVALAEFEVGGNGALTLVKYGTAALAAPLDSGAAETILAPALLQIVREKGIKPGPVALAVPGQMVFPRFASIPLAGSQDHFEKQVRFEIEQNVPFPIDEMICDRQIVGDTPDGDKAVMIVAAKIDQIESITAAVRSAGFEPEIVDVAPIALTNALCAARPDEQGAVVILDIGAKTTSLVILEGDRIYNRSIPYAGNYVTKEIAATLGCTPEEAEQFKCERAYVSLGGVTEDADETMECVAKVCRAAMTKLNAELTRSINFYRSQQGGGAPTKLYLTGGTSLLNQIDAFFAEALGVEVEFFNPFETVDVGPGIDTDALGTDAAFLATAVGLGLRKGNRAKYAINLLPPSIIAERADASRIPFLAVGAVSLVAGLALAWIGLGRQVAVTNAEREAVENRSGELKGFVTKIKAKQAELEAETKRANELERLFKSRSAVAQQLTAVRNALGSNFWIDRWAMLEAKGDELPGARVTIRGWAEAFTALEKRSAEKGGKAKTAPEIVAERLKGMTGVDAKSVKIADLIAIGKGDPVKQFVVEVRFGKRAEGKGKEKGSAK